MEFTCNSCQSSFKLPDAQLPKGKIVAFPCPDCGKKIELDLREKKAAVRQTAAETDTAAQATAGNAKDLKAKVVSNLAELPPMPQIVFKAIEIMDDPNSSTKQVADLIESDPAIATKVLRMANSAYYGLSGKVSSIQHASVVLGFKALGELITMAGTSSLLGAKLFGYDMDSGALWEHSMTVALCSKILAQRCKPELENDAFSAGLIHDVGKLILDRFVLNRKPLFEEYMQSGDRSFLSAENKILGFDHAEIGYEVCRHWKIPESLANTIRFHHSAANVCSDGLSAIVFMANTIANMAEAMEMVGAIEQNSLEAVMYLVDDDVMQHLNLDETRIGEIMKTALSGVKQISAGLAPGT